jgi:hypothetical protein
VVFSKNHILSKPAKKFLYLEKMTISEFDLEKFVKMAIFRLSPQKIPQKWYSAAAISVPNDFNPLGYYTIV